MKIIDFIQPHNPPLLGNESPVIQFADTPLILLIWQIWSFLPVSGGRKPIIQSNHLLNYSEECDFHLGHILTGR